MVKTLMDVLAGLRATSTVDLLQLMRFNSIDHAIYIADGGDPCGAECETQNMLFLLYQDALAERGA
jgi:hypothetical protein